MQRVADADFPLDLRIRQCRHDGATLHVGAAGSHVPGRHAHPELEGRGTKSWVVDTTESLPVQKFLIELLILSLGYAL